MCDLGSTKFALRQECSQLHGCTFTVTVASHNRSDVCRPDDVMITTAVKQLVTSTDCPKGCPSGQALYTADESACVLVQGLCHPTVSANDVQLLYDVCLTPVMDRQLCRSGQLSGGSVIALFECLKGEVQDPCDVIDTNNVTTLTLRHLWTSPQPSSNVTQQEQEQQQQQQQCMCEVTSQVVPQTFRFRGVSVSGGRAAVVDITDPANRVMVTVDQPLPRPQGDYVIPNSRSFSVKFLSHRHNRHHHRHHRLVGKALQMLIIKASKHPMRVTCPGYGMSTSVSAASATYADKMTTNQTTNTKTTTRRRRMTTTTTKSTFTLIDTTSGPVSSTADVSSDVTADDLTFPFSAFLLSTLSVTLSLAILVIICVVVCNHRRGRRRRRRGGRTYNIPPQRFSVIRGTDPHRHSADLVGLEPVAAPSPTSPDAAHRYTNLPWQNYTRSTSLEGPSHSPTSTSASAFAATSRSPQQTHHYINLPRRPNYKRSASLEHRSSVSPRAWPVPGFSRSHSFSDRPRFTTTTTTTIPTLSSRSPPPPYSPPPPPVCTSLTAVMRCVVQTDSREQQEPITPHTASGRGHMTDHMTGELQQRPLVFPRERNPSFISCSSDDETEVWE
ncbi:uncharacterized protein LOC143277467 [Babylonia areolata]|uniref:uncharacterized protein LOC143277467 n=1 Tax=Babylonia areolata TaxID=304850 RepID=UPI003FCFD63A